MLCKIHTNERVYILMNLSLYLIGQKINLGVTFYTSINGEWTVSSIYIDAWKNIKKIPLKIIISIINVAVSFTFVDHVRRLGQRTFTGNDA